MPAAAPRTAHAPLVNPLVLPGKEDETDMVVLKVRLRPEDKEEFAREARGFDQHASEYARFILRARKNPAVFLQFCALRDPAFAARFGAAGAAGAGDAARVAELEKQALELTHAKETAERDRDDAQRERDDLERQLAEAMHRTQALASHVVDLVRTQDANHARAFQANVPYEGVPASHLRVLKVLSGRALHHRRLLPLVTGRWGRPCRFAPPPPASGPKGGSRPMIGRTFVVIVAIW